MAKRRSTKGSTRGKAGKRAKRRAAVSLRPPSPTERKLLGLLVGGLGVFSALALYGLLSAGGLGRGVERALGVLVGEGRWLAPLLFLYLAYRLLKGPPAPEPARAAGWGIGCGGVLLALAALGGQGSTPRWGARFLERRGGVPGEALWAVAHGVGGTAGVVVLALLLVGAGLLLAAPPLAGPGRFSRWVASQLEAALLALARPPRRMDGIAEPDPVGHQAEPADPFADQDEGAEVFAARLAEPVSELTEEQTEPAAEPQEEVEVETAPQSHLLTPAGRYRAAVTEQPDFPWQLPDPQTILVRSQNGGGGPDRASQQEREKVAETLVETLSHFGVQAKVVGTVCGPHITRYELRLAPGTKVSKVAQLKDDLAYALAATEIRILAPIPGKQAVGVEVPNGRRRIVHLGDVFGEGPPPTSPLTVWLGKDVAGRPVAADLTRMPHLLVAGATGSGKSGAINAMLCSILLQATPHEVRLVLVDPKQVELNHYDGIPHLLTPVITNPRMAATALANLVREMESRYTTMSLAKTRNLPELNAALQRRGEPPLPYILCVIDELADLMMVAPADVEDSIIRLAQKARAVGIHLLLATQSPRVDVITGMIKANVPSRIAFAVSSQTDSRVILDQNGAETLLGAGDMLFSPMGSSKLQRIQGAYIDEAQIARLTDHWRRQGEPELNEELLEEHDEEEGEGGGDPDFDPLLAQAAALVVEMQTASTSMLQRRLRVGYTRAGRLIDMLERRGVVSGYEGSKPRQVLVSPSELPRILKQLEPAAAASHAGEGEDRGESEPGG